MFRVNLARCALKISILNIRTCVCACMQSIYFQPDENVPFDEKDICKLSLTEVLYGKIKKNMHNKCSTLYIGYRRRSLLMIR